MLRDPDASLAPDPARSSHPLAPAPFVVKRHTPETADTVTLELAPTNGDAAPAFRPGQFNMLYAFGLGEVAISVSGDPARRGEVVHTVRGVGKISNALARAAPGEVVGVRGPYGVGWPEAEGRDVVVVGGGIGIAPLRPYLYHLLAHRERYGRIEVIFGARSPKDLVYAAELRHWRERTDARIQVTVDAAGRDWYGDVGVVTQRLPDARFDPAITVACLCGPEIMLRVMAQALEGRGVPASSIWVSMERNMKCAIGVCGHCQFGPEFICRDGPVFRYDRIRRYLSVREL